MAKIRNLTPHPIAIYYGKNKVLELEPEELIARMREDTEIVDHIEVSGFEIPIVRKYLSEIYLCERFDDELKKVAEFPEYEEGVYLLVSFPIARVSKRIDLITVGDTIRDEKGFIIGATSLAIVRE